MPAVFSYTIVNNGHGCRANAEKALEQAGTQLAQNAAQAALLAVLYGISRDATFGFTLLYAIGFVGNLVVTISAFAAPAPE
jgi:hypothetical protein